MAATTSAITLTIAVDVFPGAEEEYLDWAEALLRDVGGTRGHLGGGLLGRHAQTGEYRLAFRFVDTAWARWWEASPEWAGHLADACGFAAGLWVRRTADERVWFAPAVPPARVPPRWKSAVVTLLAVFPPVLLFNMTLIPALRSFSLVLRTMALCVAVTMVVTWVMMPRLQRILRPWLHPTPRVVERGWMSVRLDSEDH